jgi:hypothetical protein
MCQTVLGKCADAIGITIEDIEIGHTGPQSRGGV